jgi:pSer/pThr/pTyr-binding forkhead associated (FHA) protein
MSFALFRSSPKDQYMTHQDNGRKDDHRSSEDADKTTADFGTDFLEAPAEHDSAATLVPTLAQLEELPSGSALLVVKRGPSAGSRFLLDRAVTTAGRHPDSDILLDDITVSRRHAEFALENREFRVSDVGSLNGTYVNRSPVDSTMLTNGDEIQIGRFRLVFLRLSTD